MVLKENLDKADASPREGASTDESPRHLDDVVSNFTVEGDAEVLIQKEREKQERKKKEEQLKKHHKEFMKGLDLIRLKQIDGNQWLEHKKLKIKIKKRIRNESQKINFEKKT